jgi:hypothetical protein
VLCPRERTTGDQAAGDPPGADARSIATGATFMLTLPAESPTEG